MCPQPTVRTVFEDVDPDPDAVLESFDVDSPDDLLAAAEDGHGAHDPTTDEVLDVDDASASDLFDDLSGAERDLESTPEPTAADSTSTDDGIVLSDPTVVVDEGGWSALEAAIEPSGSDRRDDGETDAPTTDEPTLVGPDPTPVRIPDDSFGRPPSGRNRSTTADALEDGGREFAWVESTGVQSGS